MGSIAGKKHPLGVGKTCKPASRPDPWFAINWLVIFSILHFLGMLLYIVGFGVFLDARGAVIEPAEIRRQLEAPASLVAMSFAGWLLVLPALLLASSFRGQSWTQTLAVRGFALRHLWRWLLALATLLAAEILAVEFLAAGQGDFTQAIAGSRHIPMVLTVVLVAPLLEELIFRGYLFRAWRRSALGLSGTLLLTSALFALAHWGQYGTEQLGFLFVFSVMMGLARERSGSVLLPVFLHALGNLLVVIFVLCRGVF